MVGKSNPDYLHKYEYIIVYIYILNHEYHSYIMYYYVMLICIILRLHHAMSGSWYSLLHV